MRFMGWAHATTLDLMRLRNEGPEPREETEDMAAEKIDILSKVRARTVVRPILTSPRPM